MTGSCSRRAVGRRTRALAAALALAAIAGCGGGDGGASGDLVWVAGPRVLVPPALPGDRILRGRVQNDSLRRIELDSTDLRLVSHDGRRVSGSTAFLGSFIRSVEPYNSGPLDLPDDELERLGRKLKLDPGDRAPLTVSWRESQGRPSQIDYGTGSLSVPSKP